MKLKRSILKKIFVITTLFGLIFGLFLMGHVYTVIEDLKLKIQAAKIVSSGTDQKESVFESDTSLNTQLFKNYILFSKTENNVYDFESLVREQKLFLEKENLFVQENFTLSPLRKNSCKRYRCIQNRREFEHIPAAVWKGLLGTEDFRFLEHRGIDPIAITRAIIVDIIALKFVQGGSTLTQQLVKNLFLTNERKLKRKFTEMIYALYIENILTKEEIITLYLNEVFWGTFQGVYLKGFHSATLAYFNKAPKDLDEFEATILISLLKGPNYYNPKKGLERLKKRTKAVFKRLEGLGLVSRNSKFIWSEKDWTNWKRNFDKRSKQTHFQSYYSVSKNTDSYLESFEKLVLFESIKEVHKNLTPRLKNADVGVKVMIADLECKSFDCIENFSFYSKQERDKRQAMTNEFHQVGSLLKPIVYESFVELGRDYDDYVETSPITLSLASGDWTPKDYSRVAVAEMKLKTALQKSKNIPLIRVASEIGFENLEKLLGPKIPRLKTPLSEYPAQLLGANEMSMEEVLGVYSSFIESKCQQVKNLDTPFEESVLYYMSDAEKTTISKLARAPLRQARVFGKTGTTNNGLDNWYYAFDGRRAYLFWFGVESKRNKFDLRLSGAVSSFLMFQKFMNTRGKLISEIICN